MYKSAARMLRLLVYPLAVCAVLLVLVPSEAAAQCRVEGTVKAADGTPVAGAMVQLISSALKGAPPTTTTAQDGTYHFDNVKPGIWAEIRVTGTGSPIVRAFSLITNPTEKIDVQAPRESDMPVSLEDLDPMGGDAGAVRGIVRAEDGSPIEGARVSIGDTDVGTRTDATGRYSFGNVRAKLSLELHVSAAGYEERKQVIKVPERGSTDADFTLGAARATDETAVTAMPADAGEDVAEMFVHPGVFPGLPTRTPDSAFRTVQFLPSVAASFENTGDLFVRGATPDQTLVTYDGFTWYPSPRLFHGLSPFNDESIAGVTLADNMFRANRGGRLAGAAFVNGDEIATGRPTGGVDLNAFGWAANASVPLGPAGSFHFGARRPLTDSLYQNALDWFSPTQFVRDRVPRFAGNTFGTSTIPTYAEYEGGVDIKAGARDRVSVNFYDARDTGNFSRDFTLPAPSTSTTAFAPPGVFQIATDAVVQGADVQEWTGRGFSGQWTHSGSTVSATASFGQSKFTRTHGQSFFLTSPTTGADYDIAAGRAGSSALLENGEIRDTTARVDATIRAGFQHAIEVGGDVNRVENSYDSSQEAIFTAAGVRVTPAMYPLFSDHTTGQIVTVFAQDVWRPAGRLTIAPGMRISHYDVTSTSYFEPRVLGSYELLRNVRFNAGWSVDHQFMTGITREDREHGDTTFWALANGTFIPVPRSEQLSGGITMEARGLLFTGQVYYRTLDDLAIFAPRLLTGVIPGPNGSGFYTGTGTSRGVDMMVEYRQDANTIWASTEVGHVEYTYPGLEPATFLGSNDKAVEFKVADSVRIHNGWSASAAWVVTSGLAYTPLQGTQQVWFPAGTTAYQARFDAKNSGRLPQYHRLDVSSQYALRFGAVTTTVGATVFNIYNRNNIQGYDTETVGTGSLVNDITMMSRAVNAFFRLGF